MGMAPTRLPAVLRFLLVVCLLPSYPKSTMEPCSVSDSDSCSAMVINTLHTKLKVSEVAGLFQIDPVVLLTSNSVDISHPDIENHILPFGLFLKIPILYCTRTSDILATIFDSIHARLILGDQIRKANDLTDPSLADAGQLPFANMMGAPTVNGSILTVLYSFFKLGAPVNTSSWQCCRFLLPYHVIRCLLLLRALLRLRLALPPTTTLLC